MTRYGSWKAGVLAGAIVAGVWMTAAANGYDQRRDRGADQAKRAATPATRITTFLENAGRLDWSKADDLITFDRRVGDGYFDIYTIRPNGTGETCLTCGKADLPPKSKGNPAWHPSGDYIAFQAQNTYEGLGAISRRLGAITDYFANPGAGVNNDLWVMDRAGRRFWRLIEVKPRLGGILHPSFNRAGDKLFWSERVGSRGPWGEWALRVADFDTRGGNVKISNIQTLQPGAQQRWYESHGFSPDGRQLLFTGNLERGQAETSCDIHLYDLETGRLTNLTQSDDWEEHAHFSPDGKTILWMSSRDLPRSRRADRLQTDYWLMDPDGSNKRRLTYFNTPGHPEYMKGGVIAADAAWSPDGSRIAGYVITDVRKGGTIMMIELR